MIDDSGMFLGQTEFDQHYRYNDSDVLGVGNLSVVFLGRSQVDESNCVALKISKKETLTEKDHDSIRNELEVISCLDHRNILKIVQAFSTSDAFIFALDLMEGGSLADLIKESSQVSEAAAKQYLKFITEALLFCKQQGVIHRDVKPGNVLLPKNRAAQGLKLCDFSVSKRFSADEKLFRMFTQVGTLYYIAPEVVKYRDQHQYYDRKCDLWSLGVLAYVLLSGHKPFDLNKNERSEKTEKREQILRARVAHGSWQFQPVKVWKQISPKAKEFVESLMDFSAHFRLDYPEILQSKWINN